ncbi:carboxylating nicotinate-nucleotide diphosphorylase [Haematomicrobium sanguinis]|uniref:carboxylating nicotinate-nucleotide diphosphorylase n=1 Tax=Haematomicrobium sanguinis TaxID=479106 RepID=UPI00047E658B|nr:carboxylating nicotinate-nucleotide diphosphorylase [Haematomicrobium sanguinis]
MILDAAAVDAVIAIAMREDKPWGDVSSAAFIPESSESQALLRAREPGVMAGASVFERAMRWGAEEAVRVQLRVQDGDAFAAGDVLAEVSGSSRAILGNERVALNLVQRMCAVSSTTARLVALVAGTGARVVDTRKTTPGLRLLEKYAVRCGGGFNHRFSLSDAIMLKDNHLEPLLAEFTRNGSVDLDAAAAEVRSRRRAAGHTLHLEIEVDRPELIDFALNAGANTIMLDNFAAADVRAAAAHIGDRAHVEVSGNITAETIADYAAAGAEVISVGALTHSAPAVDLGLDFVTSTPTTPSP